MAADLLVPAIAAALVFGGTDRGRAAAKGFVSGAASSTAKGGKGRKSSTAKARKAPPKAPARKPAARKKKGTVSAKVGAWAGQQARKAGAAAGRAGKAGAVKAGTWAGDKAQGRWDKREDPAKPVSRTQPEPSTEPGAEKSDPPTANADSTPQPATKESTVSVHGLESPQTDGQLLEQLNEAAQRIKADSEQVAEFASELMRKTVASSVTGHVTKAAESLAEAGSALSSAAHEFDNYYGEAREMARRGLKIHGEEAVTNHSEEAA